ncbi:MAG: hypothetical protein RL318_1489 [Fibrobacterota bacterium]|jgi:hypothetical protein
MTSKARCGWAWAVALLFAGALTPSFGYSSDDQDRNHPEERWFTAETEHFRFHYRKGLREAAEACASRAEAVYPEISALYGMKPGSIDFLVQDEDYSNGWAIASLSTMAIWSADLGFTFRGSKDWIRDVVAHEFSHIASIQASAKVFPWLSEIQVGWGDATGSRISSGGWGLWSLNPYSMAMAEGTAQWTSQRLGGDAWDTHRQMIERCAVLVDSLLPWERMSVFSGSGFDFERVYNQGFSMVRFVEETKGASLVPQWWHALGSPLPQEWGGAWRKVAGESGKELWKAWRDSALARAQRAREAAKPLIEGRRLVGDAYNTGHPRWMDARTLFHSSNPGADEGNNLWAWDLTDSLKDTTKRHWMVSPWIRGRYSLDSVEHRVHYVSGRKTDAQGRHVLDAWSTSLDRKDGQWTATPVDDHHRVTLTWHVAASDLSPSRDTLAAILREGMRFRVALLPADGLELPAGESLQIFPRGDTGVVGTLFAVRWHPAGRTVAIDWYDGRRRRCDLVSRDGSVKRLGDTLSEWRDVSFSPDGLQAYLSSDRTGIFNLYRQNLSNDSLLQLTSVVGGAFEPELSPDGRRLAYTGFDHTGFGLWLLDSLTPEAPRKAVRTDSGKVAPPQEQTWDLAGREQPYRPIPDRALVTPIVYFQKNAPFLYAGESQWSSMGGLRMQMLDPVRRNILYGMLLLDLTRGIDFVGPGQPNFVNPRQEKLLMVGMENRSLIPTLSLQALYQDMHGEDTVSQEDKEGRTFTKAKQSWTLHLMQVSGGARYSLTQNQKLHTNLAWTRYDFDFYDLPLRYTGYSSLTPSFFWTYYDRSDASMGVEDDPRGIMVRAQWSMDNAALMRSGSFSDVFEIDANGAIKARSTDWTVHRLAAQGRWAFGNPLWPEQTLEISGDVATVADWSGPVDTLTDFFHEGVELRGYPTMLGRERRLFQGTHALSGGLSTRIPLWEINRGAWIWYGDRIVAGASFQAGRAWSGPIQDAIDTAGLGLSLDWGLSLSGRIHANYPLALSVTFARAMRDLAGVKQADLTLPVAGVDIPLGAHRISLGVNLGFDEWSIVDQPMRRRNGLPAGSLASPKPVPFRGH